MSNRIFKTLIAIFATAVGLYPIFYFVLDRKFGLLQSKPAEVLANAAWNIGFYAHITLGGIALLVGWTQFLEKWRNRYLSVHRRMGKIYIVCTLISGTAGVFIAFYATGGIIPSCGFISLGLVWFSTTLRAYLYIKRGDITRHQKMMIYSYATCLAAVTLRIYLPVLIMLLHDFNKAYSIVAWLCWIPNLVIASFIVRKIRGQDQHGVAKHVATRTVELN